MRFLKTIRTWAIVGAVLPPIWLGTAYVWQASGLPWHTSLSVVIAEMRVTTLLWPTFFSFEEMLGNRPSSAKLFLAGLLLSMVLNAVYYAAIGSIAWIFVERAWPITRRLVRGHDVGR